MKWRCKLPGPGSSSPIVVGDKIFVTCWSGYGTADADSASPNALKRHLVCVDRKTGEILWDQSVAAALPEDNYQAMFAEHGYASHTPTSDGERVYVFYGKTGVLAYDLNGKQLWQREVGDGLDQRRWGSSCSPILYKDTVIVTAAAEKKCLYGLNKMTGEVKWQTPADNFASTWGTPILVEVDAQRTDLVIGVPFEIWGFNPDNGEFRWFCPAMETDSFCSSVVADKSIVYAVEGRSGGSIAIQAGGKDDISKTNVLWKGSDRGRIVTPIVFQDRIYFFGGGMAKCLDAKNGQEIYQERLRREVGEDAVASSSQPANRGPADTRRSGDGGPSDRGPGGSGQGRRGGGGGMGGQDYASPIVAGGMIYHQGRNGDMFVIAPGDEFKQLAVNRVSSDSDEDFSATPAAADGQLYIRSSKFLYNVGH
jgi:outer membrane protein assembly factor BamB